MTFIRRYAVILSVWTILIIIIAFFAWRHHDFRRDCHDAGGTVLYRSYGRVVLCVSSDGRILL